MKALLFLTDKTLPTLDHSLLTQFLFCEIKDGDIDPKVLSQCQVKASNGHYAKVLEPFIEYILVLTQESNTPFSMIFEYYNKRAIKALGCKSSSIASCNVANLMVSINLFLNYCESKGFISNERYLKLCRSQWKRIISLFKSQESLLQSNGLNSETNASNDIVK